MGVTFPFTIAKNTLIQIQDKSEEPKLNQLLNDLKADFGKTQLKILLQSIRHLAGSDASETFIKSAWLQRFPEITQDIHRAMPNTLLENMAKVADAIHQRQASTYSTEKGNRIKRECCICYRKHAISHFSNSELSNVRNRCFKNFKNITQIPS